MSFYRVLNTVLKLPNVIAKRNVSEYAKKFGYKMKTPDKEVRVNNIKNFFYFAGTALLFADMAWDKQQHYEAYTKDYDENKKYYKPEIRFGLIAQPNMDFLTENIGLRYKDENTVPVSSPQVEPPFNPPIKDE